MNPPRVTLPSLIVCSAGFLCLAAAPAVQAGPLQRAEVQVIVNDVRLVDAAQAQGKARPARLGDVVQDQVAVRTGGDSRAELIFQDKTLTRVGPNSLFSFKAGTRKVSLDRGTLLLQVPKGLGGAEIRTAAVTAAITGTTILIENLPDKHFKVLVLEGSLRLSSNRMFGGSVTLKPGKMVVMGAQETRIPKPVTVDLQKLVKTSTLIDASKFQRGSKRKAQPLPSTALIEREISVQEVNKAASRLTATNLVVSEEGVAVTKRDDRSAPEERGLSAVRSDLSWADVSNATALRTEVTKSNGKEKSKGLLLAAAVSAAGKSNSGKDDATKAAEAADKQSNKGKGNNNSGNGNNGNGNSGNSGNGNNGNGNGNGNSGKGKGNNK